MSDYRKHEILSGLFILAAVVVFTLFAFKVGDVDVLAFLRGDVLECEAYFQNAGSIDAGSKVVVAGRRVGQVTAVSLVPPDQLSDHAREGRIEPLVKVSFEIEDQSVVIDQATARVVLTRDGLLGGQFLQLRPGTWPADKPPTKSQRAAMTEPVVIQVGQEPGIQDVIAQAVPVIENVNLLLADLQKTVSTINTKIISDDEAVGVLSVVANLNSTIGQSRDLIKRLTELTALEHPDGLHQRVLLPMQKLIENADKDVNELTDILKNQTLASVNRILKDGEETMTLAKQSLTEFNDILKQSNPKIQTVLDDLKTTVGKLDGYLRTIAENAEKLLKNLDGTVTENRPDVRETVRRLRRTMWQAEMALRKIRSNPAVLLLGDNEKDLEAEPSDQSILRIEGRARPYGQRDERDGK